MRAVYLRVVGIVVVRNQPLWARKMIQDEKQEEILLVQILLLGVGETRVPI